MEHWCQVFGSGSLRRAIEEKLAWREMYLHERAAFEFGAGFTLCQASRLRLGTPLAEPDERSTTETCWYARVLRWRFASIHPGLIVVVRSIEMSVGDEPVEGVGLVLEGCLPTWVPNGRIPVAIVAREGHSPENPC